MAKRDVRKVFMILLFASFLIVLPINMALPEQTLDKALVLAVGVDQAERGYEVSIQLMVPQSNQNGYTEKRVVESDRGITVEEALLKLQLKVGKELALAHTNLIILSEKILQDDILDILDYFIRSRDIVKYVLVATTQDSAKEVLDLATQEDAGASTLIDLISFNDEKVNGRQTTVYEILNGYYSPSKTSIVTRIELAPKNGEDTTQSPNDSQSGGGSGGADAQNASSESGAQGGATQSNNADTQSKNATQSAETNKNTSGPQGESNSRSGDTEQSAMKSDGAIKLISGLEEQNKSSSAMDSSSSNSSDSGTSSGSSSSSGSDSSGSGSSSSSSSSAQEKELHNEASVVVLREGKLVKIFGSAEYRGFHWLMPVKETADIILNDISDDNLKNAQITLKIMESKDKIKCEMTADNRPIVKFTTDIKYQITSAVQDEYSELAYAEFTKDSTKVIKPALQKLIDNEIQVALQTSKELQIDLWQLYDKFHQKFGKRFTRYVELNEGDYLKDLEIFVDINVDESKF